jgi:hypothetical protein
VRRRLEATFDAETVPAAERRVRRRRSPSWSAITVYDGAWLSSAMTPPAVTAAAIGRRSE